MEFMVKNDLCFMIIFCLLTKLANSFCDAIKFSCQESAQRHDNLWHWIKWGIDRPAMYLFGFFSFRIIYDQFSNNDLWHYDDEFLILLAVFGVSFFLWHYNYRVWKNYFKR